MRVFFILLALGGTLFSQVIKEQAVTIYNDYGAIVRDVREFDLTSGESEIKMTDVASSIHPSSVKINFNGSVIEQNYRYDLVSIYKILVKYIDKQVSLISPKGEIIEGTLLNASSQTIIRNTDGTITMIPNIEEYRLAVGALPDGLITRPTLVWKINSEKSGKQNVEVTYKTDGISWNAEYVLVLNEDDTKMDVSSWVSIDNQSGGSFKNAKIKLIAGNVNKINEYSGRGRKVASDRGSLFSTSAEPQFEEKEFFEYHIYNLGRTTDLLNAEEKQISLFNSDNVSIEKQYIYSPSYWGNNEKQNLLVYLHFENSEKNNMGMPLPKGKIRIFKKSDGAAEFIGEDYIKHTSRNEKIRLKVGEAFDVLGQSYVVKNKKISDTIDEKGYEIILTNRKKIDIIVFVDEELSLNEKIISNNFEYEKLSPNNIRFKVPVKADSEIKLNYEVRITKMK